jgi:hypothetical protein
LYLGGAGALGLGSYVYLQRMATAQPAQVQSPLDPQNFVDFKLKKVESYNHNTAKCESLYLRSTAILIIEFRFIFELPDNQASLLPVASCVVVKASDPEALKDAMGKPIVRPYTPISPSDAVGELTFLIKRYENGNASKYIHTLSPGDTLAIKGPISKWPYKSAFSVSVAMLSR